MKKEIARELIQCLNILNDLVLGGKQSSDDEVKLWLNKYYVLLQDYHGSKK